MSKSKQQQRKQETTQEERYLFAIETPEGETIIKIGVDGNIMELKDQITLTEASRAFWNIFQTILPVTQEDIDSYPNDQELGASIRNRMAAKNQIS